MADSKNESDVWGEEDVTSAKNMGDENFPVGSLLIAPACRPVIHAYYRFARVADDMVDNARLSSEQKKGRLLALREVLLGNRIAPMRADAQTAVRLRSEMLERNLPLSLASDLITAFVMDAEKNRYQSWGELLDYCRYSANPVGRFLLAVHREGMRLQDRQMLFMRHCKLSIIFRMYRMISASWIAVICLCHGWRRSM